VPDLIVNRLKIWGPTGGQRGATLSVGGHWPPGSSVHPPRFVSVV